MGEHVEVMEDLGLSRIDYLKFIRKQQPVCELQRKAAKAKRKSIWTQEDMDLAAAQAMTLISRVLWDE